MCECSSHRWQRIECFSVRHSALSSDASDVWTVPEVAIKSLALLNEHQQDSGPTASSPLRTNDVKYISCNLGDVANAEGFFPHDVLVVRPRQIWLTGLLIEGINVVECTCDYYSVSCVQ